MNENNRDAPNKLLQPTRRQKQRRAAEQRRLGAWRVAMNRKDV